MRHVLCRFGSAEISRTPITPGYAVRIDSEFQQPLADPSAGRNCDGCGYDLRGLDDNRCPECGLRFNPAIRPAARIPWLRRSHIGFFAGYWQTVLFLTLHPVQFVAEAARPGGSDFVGARSFRTACVRCALVSCMVPVVAAVASSPGCTPQIFCYMIPPLGGLGFAVWYFLTMLTDVALVDVTFFLGGRNLAWEVVLSDYSAGLLGWSPVPGLLAAASVVLLNAGYPGVGGLLFEAFLCSAAALALMLLLGPGILFRLASRRGMAACLLTLISVIGRFFSAGLTALFVFGLSLVVTIPLALLIALLWQEVFGR
ncbi:MAG: hypothetical protein JWN51_2693 [Phycisphaerales bacterium]|nr:hypothetical protein [Phycisphaerales bacterium]